MCNRFEIEARMVPMTGQNAVLNAAALEWETHVGATIIQGEDTPPIIEDEDRTMAPVHNEPPLRLQFLKATGERKFLVRCVHEHTSLN
jgi:hypothetical protein